MNINMTRMQLAHYNFHFLITAVDCHTWITLLKVQVLVVQVVEIELLDVDLVKLEVPVEVQLILTSSNRRSCRRNRSGRTRRSNRPDLVTNKPDLNKLGRRDLPKSQL
jgi:hypothetical protein